MTGSILAIERIAEPSGYDCSTDFINVISDEQLAREELAIYSANYLQEQCEINKGLESTQTSRFHSVRIPPITLLEYFKRIAKFSNCSPECFVSALVYVDIYSIRSKIPLTFKNVHRLIITAVMVAAKLRDDKYYSNAFYGNIGGVKNLEMNALELDFLSVIDWKTWVEPRLYENYYSQLVKRYGCCSDSD